MSHSETLKEILPGTTFSDAPSMQLVDGTASPFPHPQAYEKNLSDFGPQTTVGTPSLTSTLYSHPELSEGILLDNESPISETMIQQGASVSAQPVSDHPRMLEEIQPDETWREAGTSELEPFGVFQTTALADSTSTTLTSILLSHPELTDRGRPKSKEPSDIAVGEAISKEDLQEVQPESTVLGQKEVSDSEGIIKEQVPNLTMLEDQEIQLEVKQAENSEALQPRISKEYRKAIIDTLSRKTVSQDAIFEEVFQGKRKYVSEAKPRTTITDHSKDSEELTLIERQGLMDAASRRTVLQHNSIPELRPDSAWNDDPMSTKDVNAQMAGVPLAFGTPMFEPAGAFSTEMSSAAIISATMLELETSKRPSPELNLATVSPTKSQIPVSRDDEPKTSLEDQKPSSQTLSCNEAVFMEDIAQEQRHGVGTPSQKPINEHKGEILENNLPLETIRIEKEVHFDPLEQRPSNVPFSPKERRELVRSISVQIKDPDIPLWGMDSMDISEREDAEKTQKPEPEPFEPTFDFDEPIKPKAPPRRSKRHRLVRVHATDYARAQAVESEEFCTNKIKSSKYTLMTFLPMNLFLQFTRVANLYFLLIASLQLIPGFSPTSWGTTVTPLAFVLLLNAIKEAIDEFKRSISDRSVNKQKVEVLNENSFFITTWSSIIVGDIVRVKSDQEFPADLVFLSSADPKGLAYVETANLDGETNLKIRNAFYKGSSTTAGEEDETPLPIFSGLTIECELPNNRLYKFEGAINLQDYGKLPLDTRQILLRGATLRNTDWILGVVVYTGADTKFVRNMIPGQFKTTELERCTNILVAIVFVCQVSICVGLASAADDWSRDDDNNSHFIPDFSEIVLHRGPEPNAIAAQFGRFLILLNQLIPISLYVSLEVVKVVQSYLIDWDVHMFHDASKAHAKARTTNLNEELGQVQYVMADKTGTLTQNIMAFVQCSIGGEVYGTIQHEVGPQVGATKKTIHTLSNDPKLIQKLHEVAEGAQDIESEFVQSFFIHLALCHVVHPVLSKKGEEGVEEDSVLKYTGASPDEEALVQGAADCGYELKKRAPDELLVLIPGLGLQKFTILAVLEFTSERKRMSIICKDPQGRIKLYCKGADSVIFKRLWKGQESLIETSLNQLEDFARCGYRTICMAERQLSPWEYERWADRFRAASVALDDRDEKLAAVSETIERDMMLLGVTAVEDKLQGKVPETITLLAQAGIKVWVLTGDKLETAVSIALSCSLLADSMHLFLLSENVSNSVPQLLRIMLDEARRQHTSKLKMEGSDYHSEMATVIEGSSLTIALEESNKLVFLELLQLCRSVVCCRVSPIQKAQVTILLKEHGNAVILAIGDGANDCGMIRVAQIGVGIGGREGMAAVMASDYSISRFRYLRRLLLVHGRWSYKRNRELVMYAFYKNIVYTLGNVYLANHTGFSSQPLYSSVEIATYNLIWTALPTMVFAVFDKDLSDCTAENNPQLYMETQTDKRPQFFWSLTGWTLCAFWDSIVAFCFPIAMAHTSGYNGESMGIWYFGSIVYTMAVFIVNLKIITRIHNFTWFHFGALNISTSLWLLVFFCLSFAFQLSGFFAELAGVGEVVTRRPVFWLLLMLCPVAASLPGYAVEIFRNQHAPADSEVMREIEHGWTDGIFFPDAPDYVEQISAPIPERRTSLETTEEDYGPSPLQKEIADAKGASLTESGDAAKPDRSKETEAAVGLAPASPKPATGTAPLPPKVDEKKLLPRRLTWREVVNDDELEDLATTESLGRHGRRRSSGFQVVTRHTDAPEAPVPLVHGPAPTQRKSVLFQQDTPRVNAAIATVAARRASILNQHPERVDEDRTRSPKPSALKSKQPKHAEGRPRQSVEEDARLKALKAKLAKYEEERRALVSGPAALSKKTKKKQKIWDAVMESSADPEDDRFSRPRAQHPSTSSSSRSPGPRSLGAHAPTLASPRQTMRHDPGSGAAHSPLSSKQASRHDSRSTGAHSPSSSKQPARHDPSTERDSRAVPSLGKAKPPTVRTTGDDPSGPSGTGKPPSAPKMKAGEPKPRGPPGHSRFG